MPSIHNIKNNTAKDIEGGFPVSVSSLYECCEAIVIRMITVFLLIFNGWKGLLSNSACIKLTWQSKANPLSSCVKNSSSFVTK
uniref:Uncharacterized protein n=1 Tax=Steinernema glaseri TaxID=37863 RepID=A0A1I8A508_9BILA